MLEKDLITAKQAARLLGRSQSAISRALKDGRLEYIDPVKRLLFRPGLEVRFARRTRQKIDCSYGFWCYQESRISNCRSGHNYCS